MRRPLIDCRLYAFVDTAYLAGRAPTDVARALCDGGADVIQLRAKDQPTEVVRGLATALAPVVEQAGAWFVVNDHPDVAREVGAPLCHLGQEDFFGAGFQHIRDVRGAGETVALGLSSHAPAEAERAVRAGAEYVAVGPVYATPTKPGRPAVTLDYVRWAARHLAIPWFAIGGITLENLDAVLAAGAMRICVVRAILERDDLARACQEFRHRLASVA